MKLYDFRCNGCGHEFEELVREVADARCPTCSSSDVAKQLSAFSVGGVSGEPASSPASGCVPCCGGGACGLG